MKKISPLIPLVIVAGGGLFLYARSKKKAVEKLQFEPVNVNLSGKFPSYKADLQLQITNPSSTPLSVASIFADVLFGSGKDLKVIGKIVLDKSFTITPKKQNLITIPVKLNIGQALATIITLLYQKEKPKVFIRGTINSEGIDLPIDTEIPLTA
jgi:LEA14-like dessication related protein